MFPSLSLKISDSTSSTRQKLKVPQKGRFSLSLYEKLAVTDVLSIIEKIILIV